MDAALQTAIDVATARLRKAFPRVEGCHVAIDAIGDGKPRFSARMDIRLPQRQVLVCGRASADVQAALDAAFEEARERHLDAGI